MDDPTGTAERPIEELSLSNLYVLEAGLKYQAERVKIDLAAIAAEYARRLGDSAKRSYEQAGKDSGTLSLELQDGLTAKCDISKKVEWDSAKLQAIAQTMPWERVAAIFKIVFAVPETIYKGIAAADPALKAKLDEARTTKLAPVKITLTKEAALAVAQPFGGAINFEERN
jgi:hypothetical protein